MTPIKLVRFLDSVQWKSTPRIQLIAGEDADSLVWDAENGVIVADGIHVFPLSAVKRVELVPAMLTQHQVALATEELTKPAKKAKPKGSA